MTLFSYLILGSAVLVVLFIYILLTYNSVIRQIYRVKQEYSNIDIQLKKRSSLLQNLVDIVKTYAKHEKQTFEDIAKARSMVDISKNVTDSARAENLLSQTYRSLYVVVESYPELKANENFQNLHNEFKRTEDSIAIYREEYNKAVLQYNTLIQTFPNLLVTTLFNFQPSPFFEAKNTDDNKITI